MRHRRHIGWLSVFLIALSVAPAHAQLNTQHIKGTVGLKGGSQPPPDVYVIAPLIYVYGTDTVEAPSIHAAVTRTLELCDTPRALVRRTIVILLSRPKS
jgi:hypothetical protein